MKMMAMWYFFVYHKKNNKINEKDIKLRLPEKKKQKKKKIIKIDDNYPSLINIFRRRV